MDLRPYIKNQSQVNKGIELIKSNELFYQPFIITDNLEVGEGQNFCDHYKDVKTVFDLNVYAEGIDFDDRKLAPNKEYFRECNEQYRYMYDYVATTIKSLLGDDISNTSFAEIGCNTGLNLFNLAKMGAKSCAGYDWNNLTATFNWLNDILGTNVQFRQGIWDNLYHNFTTLNVPEVDVMINTIYTNHQCDPLQFLAYICDRAKKGAFLWVLISHEDEGYNIQFSHEAHDILVNGSLFPMCINNDVSFSKKLFIQSLKSLGFGEVTELAPDMTNNKLKHFTTSFMMFYAKRTSEVRSAYWQREHSLKNLIPKKSLLRKMVSKMT
jgi:SAM-dependent methyltransferase